MFTIHREEIEWGGRKLILETGKIARQADGAVLVTYGETVVLCTAVAQREPMDVDFFPLTVHYQEKTYAAGRIPGGFLKREARPSDFETFTSRLIDRPIRPLFADGFKNDTQVICTVLSHDLENASDIPALIGTSAALAISGIPFLGPIGAAQVGMIEGQFVLNPTKSQKEDSILSLIVAGTKEGVLMVESEAEQLTEQQMLDAVMFGHEGYQPVIKMIESLAKKAGKEAWPLPEANPDKDQVANRVKELAEEELRAAYSIKEKQARTEKISTIKSQSIEALAEEEFDPALAAAEFKALESSIVRGDVLKTGQRIDGRDTTTVRPITCEVGLLPRTHGSALFTRGETQALVVMTLGTGQDEKIVDALEGEYKDTFLLHYNFPPFSVGETGRLGTTSRREIGHGKLAWRAVHPLLPSKEDFPYTLRIVSEITESNGSSSMATVCGASLAMMDAGVPLKSPVAGIAMGLIKEGNEFAVLSDILGDEDHLGDMDFKVAGTEDGITALQMDIKITSITKEIMEVALDQARGGRLHILDKMAEALTSSREGVSDHAPKVVTLTVKKDKIRDIIGPGGKIIREICEVTGARVDIDDDGTVSIASADQNVIDEATKWIQGIVAEPEIGVIYQGEVVKLADFGAFVNFLGSRDGLVHISELENRRVEKVSDVVKVGDKVFVKVIGVDNRGKVKLSMKVVDQESGTEAQAAAGASH